MHRHYANVFDMSAQDFAVTLMLLSILVGLTAIDHYTVLILILTTMYFSAQTLIDLVDLIVLNIVKSYRQLISYQSIKIINLIDKNIVSALVYSFSVFEYYISQVRAFETPVPCSRLHTARCVEGG